MGKVPVTQSVIELIEPVLMANGLELVDVEFKKEGKSWVLRIYIDKKSGVTLADCQKVSGLVGDLIDIEKVIDPDYTLEISSPGLNRALKKEKDFIKICGIQNISFRNPSIFKRNFFPKRKSNVYRSKTYLKCCRPISNRRYIH